MCDLGTVCCWDAWTVVPVLCLASQFFPSWASWHKSKGWTLLMWQSQVRWCGWQWWWALPPNVWAKYYKLNQQKEERDFFKKVKRQYFNEHSLINFNEHENLNVFFFQNVLKFKMDLSLKETFKRESSICCGNTLWKSKALWLLSLCFSQSSYTLGFWHTHRVTSFSHRKKLHWKRS